MKKPTKTDWIRLAAFIDGEGTIAIKNLTTKSGRYSQLFVAIANCDPRLPMWCHKKFGGLIYANDHNAARRRGKNWNRFYRWIQHSASAERLIRGCMPYFLIKKEQAAVALAYRETFLFKGGKGSARILSDADIAIRQKCREELHRLKREIPEDAFLGAPLTVAQRETIQ